MPSLKDSQDKNDIQLLAVIESMQAKIKIYLKDNSDEQSIDTEKLRGLRELLKDFITTDYRNDHSEDPFIDGENIFICKEALAHIDKDLAEEISDLLIKRQTAIHKAAIHKPIIHKPTIHKDLPPANIPEEINGLIKTQNEVLRAKEQEISKLRTAQHQQNSEISELHRAVSRLQKQLATLLDPEDVFDGDPTALLKANYKAALTNYEAALNENTRLTLALAEAHKSLTEYTEMPLTETVGHYKLKIKQLESVIASQIGRLKGNHNSQDIWLAKEREHEATINSLQKQNKKLESESKKYQGELIEAYNQLNLNKVSNQIPVRDTAADLKAAEKAREFIQSNISLESDNQKLRNEQKIAELQKLQFETQLRDDFDKKMALLENKLRYRQTAHEAAVVELRAEIQIKDRELRDFKQRSQSLVAQRQAPSKQAYDSLANDLENPSPQGHNTIPGGLSARNSTSSASSSSQNTRPKSSPTARPVARARDRSQSSPSDTPAFQRKQAKSGAKTPGHQPTAIPGKTYHTQGRFPQSQLFASSALKTSHTADQELSLSAEIAKLQIQLDHAALQLTYNFDPNYRDAVSYVEKACYLDGIPSEHILQARKSFKAALQEDQVFLDSSLALQQALDRVARLMMASKSLNTLRKSQELIVTQQQSHPANHLSDQDLQKAWVQRATDALQHFKELEQLSEKRRKMAVSLDRAAMQLAMRLFKGDFENAQRYINGYYKDGIVPPFIIHARLQYKAKLKNLSQTPQSAGTEIRVQATGLIKQVESIVDDSSSNTEQWFANWQTDAEKLLNRENVGSNDLGNSRNSAKMHKNK